MQCSLTLGDALFSTDGLRRQFDIANYPQILH